MNSLRDHPVIRTLQIFGRPLTKRILAGIITVILTALAGYFTMMLASSSEVDVGPLRLGFELTPAWHGKSVVNLPPAGSVEADTHMAPADVALTLKEVNVNRVEELTEPSSEARQQLLDWRQPVGDEVRSMLIRVALLSMLAGGVLAALLRRRWQWALAGAAVALATTSLAGGVIYKTYNTEAFEEPRYNGNLSYAPDILAFSQQTLANLDAYEDRVPEIASSLYNTINQLHELPASLPGNANTIKVLHISDMEESSAGARLTKTVADLYEIDFVIDTGDSTQLGTAFEVGYLTSYLPLAKPYVWVAGNHETPTITGAMKAIPGVRVMENDFTEIAGIKIGGFPDPAAANISPASASDEQLNELAGKISRQVDSTSPRPFIVATHDPKMISQLAGKVPILLYGHTHRENIDVKKGTVVMDAGTTGGGGPRNFEQQKEFPSTLHILYIQKDPMKLTAVDTITIYGFSQEFSVVRRVFTAGEGSFGGLQAPAAFAAQGGRLLN